MGLRLPFLDQVPDPPRREIEGRLRVVRAKKGRTLLEKDTRSTDVFFLREGSADVLLYSPNGDEVCVHDIRPDAIFGEIAILDGEPRSASVVASCDLMAVAMSSRDFLTCLESSPAAAIWVSRHLVSSVRRLTERVFELSAMSVQARLWCELQRLAGTGVQRGKLILVRPRPTQGKIARKIGTSRESVSREMRVLSDENIVQSTIEGLTIDLFRLERLLEQWKGIPQRSVLSSTAIAPLPFKNIPMQPSVRG